MVVGNMKNDKVIFITSNKPFSLLLQVDITVLLDFSDCSGHTRGRPHMRSRRRRLVLGLRIYSIFHVGNLIVLR